MFTGIIECVGEILEIEPLGEGRRLAVAAPWAEDLAIGESIAVDGCCLTVVERAGARFVVEAVRETLHRTIVGDYEPGRRVNLERALRVGDRLGGHLVQGHVDGVVTVRSLERRGENRYISIGLPEPRDLRLVASQGSIALNGVSLTVLELDATSFRVSIVPHTWEATALSDLEVDQRVNVEYDVIARYIQRIMEMQ